MFMVLFINKYVYGVVYQQIRMRSNNNAVQKLMRKTTNFNGNSHFLGIRKVLNLRLKAEIQLQKENHTEDWALGSHPRDNGHVTH